MATKAQRHKVKLFAKIYLCVLVSWWRKCFAIKYKKITIKLLNRWDNVRCAFEFYRSCCLGDSKNDALHFTGSLSRRALPVEQSAKKVLTIMGIV